MNRENYEWYWNEEHSASMSFETDSDVAAYEMNIRKTRDVDSENAHILSLLNLDSSADILEIGSAAGSFSRLAAHSVNHVTAVDISAAMLNYAAKCADSEGLDNISFQRAGFLSFEVPEASMDAAVSRHAFHHLPDLWKAVALGNIRHALKTGGRFVLFDIVFQWRGETPENYFRKMLAEASENQIDFTSYFSHEYSTFDWILRGMIERAGFRIEMEQDCGGFRRLYSCKAI